MGKMRFAVPAFAASLTIAACTEDFGVFQPRYDDGGLGGSDGTAPDAFVADTGNTDTGIGPGVDASDAPTSSDTGADAPGCGAPSQACCAGNKCNGKGCCDPGNNVCYANNRTCSQSKSVCQSKTCVPCGDPSQPCCQGSTCNGMNCCDVAACVADQADCPMTGGGAQCNGGMCN
jgi:hypothetical protein